MASLLHPIGPEPPRTYWWRRGLVVAGLVVVIVIIVLMVKAASGSSDAAEVATKGTPSAPASAPESTETTPPPPPPPLARACTAEELAVIIAPVDPSHRQFSGTEIPSFTVTATNIGTQACSVATAPESMTLFITSGSDNVFSSADCRPDDATDENRQEVAPGVAIEFPITWDPVVRSAAGCPSGLEAPGRAPGATYIAEVTLKEGTKSDQAPFVLS